ncbi:MAG: epimerase [Flavobacteriales bacterium]|nr:MAG: epimerase [Flavobacteriales bacterium]
MIEHVLVTGGCGFIGSNLVDKLIEQKQPVICLDNLDNFYSKERKLLNIQTAEKSDLFTFIEGDIRDKSSLKRVFENYKIISVIHLAAKAGVRPSIETPSEYFDVNVTGTLNILEMMQKFNVKKLIFSSSSSVYGNNVKIPYHENDNVDFPISPYAASKKSGELLTHTFHSLYGIDVINLRFFTVYGPRQRPDLAIHKFFKLLYANEPIELYGDGSTSRDYTFIDDIVTGIISSLTKLNNKQNIYETINLGNHSPITLIELIDLIEKTTGLTFKKNHIPMQQGDVDRTYADIEKASSYINYTPKTSMNDGLKLFKQWYEKTMV